jgi:lipid-binding SYLF domain-containing protein
MKRSNFRIYPISTLVVAMVALLLSGCARDRGARPSYSYNLPAGTVEKVEQSNEIVDDFFSRTGKDIPPSVLNNAAGIAVIPGLTRAAFIVGGSRGTGVLMTREGERWNLPVFTSITGGSLGFQIGITTTDLLLVFQNPEAINKLKDGSYELGADVTVAAGPAGGTAGLSSKADVLAYKRTEGAFAGAALNGARMSIDPERTAEYYYGPNAETARGYYSVTDDLLIPGRKADIQNIPRGAQQLKQTLERIAGRK